MPFSMPDQALNSDASPSSAGDSAAAPQTGGFPSPSYAPETDSQTSQSQTTPRADQAPDTSLNSEPDPDRAQADGDGAKPQPFVPYDRFKEVNDQFSAFKPLIDSLREQGIASYDDIVAAQSRQAQEEDQRRAEAEQQQSLETLATQLTEQVDLGNITQEMAERLYRAEQTQIQTQTQQRFLQGQLADMAVQQARAELPGLSQRPELERILRGTPDPQIVRTVTQEVKALLAAAEQRGRDAYAQELARGGSAPPPLAAAGGAPAPPDVAVDPNHRWSITEALRATTGRRYGT